MTIPEKLRERREREFQSRVLASLEKPKQRNVTRIINSPFFLWFASAVFLTIAGSFITSYQQCTREASQIEERFQRLKDEINYRKDYIAKTVAAAQSPTDFNQRIKRSVYMYGDFKDRTIADIRAELARLKRKIDTTGVAAVESHMLPQTNYDESSSEIVYSALEDGTAGDIDFNRLEQIKKLQPDYARHTRIDYDIAQSLEINPRCTLSNIRAVWLGTSPKSAYARVAPDAFAYLVAVYNIPTHILLGESQK